MRYGGNRASGLYSTILRSEKESIPLTVEHWPL